jgi:hypothetical protein
MPAFLNPLSFLVACLSGWLNQHSNSSSNTSLKRIEFFGSRSVAAASASPTINGDDSLHERKNSAEARWPK